MRRKLCFLVTVALLGVVLVACGNGGNALRGSLAPESTLTWALQHTSDTAVARGQLQWGDLLAMNELGRFKHSANAYLPLPPHNLHEMWYYAGNSFVALTNAEYVPVLKHEVARVVEVTAIGSRTPASGFGGPTLRTAGLPDQLKRSGAVAEPTTALGHSGGSVFVEQKASPFPLRVVDIRPHQVVFGKSLAVDRALARPTGQGLYALRVYRAADACLGDAVWTAIVPAAGFLDSPSSRAVLAIGGGPAAKVADNLICEVGLTPAQASTVAARLRQEWTQRRSMPSLVKNFWEQISQSRVARLRFDGQLAVRDTVGLRLVSLSAVFLLHVAQGGSSLDDVLNPRFDLTGGQHT